nr:uncharacterized protein LOC115255434 [Aedes albopictus]
MIVKRNIASYVTIDSESTHLTYYGQHQTCRYCSEFVHNGVSCVQNKKLLVQKLAANNASYADVTKNPQSTRTKTVAAKQMLPAKIVALKPSGKPPQQPQTAVVPSSSGSMPPPAGVNDSSATTNGQQGEQEGDQWTRVTRSKTGQQKKNGRQRNRFFHIQQAIAQSKQTFDEFHHAQQALHNQLRRAYDGFYQNPAMLSTINRLKGEMLALQRRFTQAFVHINTPIVAGEPLSVFQLGDRRRKRTTIARLDVEQGEKGKASRLMISSAAGLFQKMMQ